MTPCNSLTPMLPECPTGWYVPCVEACRRDVTTCCYYEAKQHSESPLQRSLKITQPKSAYHCTKCGTTDEQDFGDRVLTLCCACDNERRRAEYARDLERKRSKAKITRTCRTCGTQFQCHRNHPRIDCPECRSKAKAGRTRGPYSTRKAI